MLDTETKRRIDTARDILVGKVPDPKSQVEQITIALIYKFMDDIDAESEELGGKRSFFAGEFTRYGWAKLMRSGLGGHETAGIYAEAIARMPENPGIPALFRDIFKNAYLPYRDPETLRAFLKIIDEFTYDHSERLGDAFEYLLSVLGSQGDAGQFRTPRHIIDFIVAIVGPKKTETVLDPACGTAGFLISSYKHILKANTDANGNSTLTPDERGRLAKNFTGYDISPDMVRLSLVNLYLHGFADPHVYEYDTLTSQDRWNECADVILANPPFMSPTGGIKPHNRFSVQSKRSEVLFVDYMAEHLTPTGRAGIIVPEGIIFQSQTAYTRLRKMLVEQYLVAVVSLPAGVFNPYSGVKTSILILDKSLARKTPTIAFFKVENDGFGLGAQRRAIGKNDLPQAHAEIGEYLRRLRAGESIEDVQPTLGLIVEKYRVAANGHYNLSGEKYRERASAMSAWPFVPVGQVFRRSDQTVLPDSLNGAVTYIGLENIAQNTGEIIGSIVTEKPSDIRSLKNVFWSRDILYGKLRPNLNKVWLADRNGICSTDIFVIEPLDGRADTGLYVYLFRSGRFNDAVMGQLKGAQLPRVGWSSFAELKIPLPPLEVQKEIVAEIEGYQNVIDGARAVLDHYRPHIPIHPDWPMVPIKEIASVESGFGFPTDYQGKTDEEIPFLKVSDMNLAGNETRIVSWNNTVSGTVLRELKAKAFPPGTVIFPKIGAAIATNKKRILTRDSTYDNNVMGIVPCTTRLLPDYLHTYLFAVDLSQWASDAQPPSMRKTVVEAHAIPLPPLATQQAIVAEIEVEQALVAANRELIARFEKKIQVTLARVWGEEKATPFEG
jgi:type I restriction enzyme M protein